MLPRFKVTDNSGILPEHSTVLCSPEMENYGVDRWLLAIKAHCGAGKTVAMIRSLEDMPDHHSIIVICPLRFLCRDMHRKLTHLGFVLYMDLPPGAIDPRHITRLVITPESLHRLSGAEYQVVVLEEALQLVQAFTSRTMTKWLECYGIFAGLLQICRNAHALDAALDAELVDQLAMLAKRDPMELVHFVQNDYVRSPRRAEWTTSQATYMGCLLRDLSEGKQVAIYSLQSAEGALALHKKLTKLGHKGLCITGELAEDEKKALFADTALVAAEAQYLITTPVMLSGVSVTKFAVDRAYMDYRLISQIPSNSAFQMLHRVREVRDSLVRILTDERFANLPTTRQEVLDALADRKIGGDTDPSLGPISWTTGIGGVRTFHTSPAIEFVVGLRMREFRDKNDLAGALGRLMSAAGYQHSWIHEDSFAENKEVIRAGKAAMREIRANRVEIRDTKAQITGTAPILETVDFVELGALAARGRGLTPSDAASIERQELAELYSVPVEEVTPEFVLAKGGLEAKRIQRNRNCAALPLNELRRLNAARIARGPKELTDLEASLPKHVAVREILEGMGMASGVHTATAVPRAEVDAAILTFAPAFRQSGKRYYSLLGKRDCRPPATVDLKFFTQFLEKPLTSLYGATWRRQYASPKSHVVTALAIML